MVDEAQLFRILPASSMAISTFSLSDDSLDEATMGRLKWSGLVADAAGVEGSRFSFADFPCCARRVAGLG